MSAAHYLTAIWSTSTWLVFGCACGAVIVGDATDALATAMKYVEHRDGGEP